MKKEYVVFRLKDYSQNDGIIELLEDFLAKKVEKARYAPAQRKYIPCIIEMLKKGKRVITSDDLLKLHPEQTLDINVINNCRNLKQSLESFLEGSIYRDKYMLISDEAIDFSIGLKELPQPEHSPDKLNLFKDFICEFVELVKYSSTSPGKLKEYQMSNFKWLLHTSVLYIVMFSAISSVLLNNIPDAVAMNEPEQVVIAQEALKGFGVYIYNFIGYLLYAYLFSLPYKKLAKAEFQFGEFAFANMLPTFLFVMLGIPLFFAKLVYAPNIFSVYDLMLLVVTATFFYFHFRNIKSVVCLKGFGFARIYAVSFVFLAVSTSVLKLIY